MVGYLYKCGVAVFSIVNVGMYVLKCAASATRLGDQDCIQILKNCHKVLPLNGKLLIREQVIDPSKNSATQTGATYKSDILMLALFQGNGKERTTAEWECLLEAARFSHISFLRLQSLDLIESIKT